MKLRSQYILLNYYPTLDSKKQIDGGTNFASINFEPYWLFVEVILENL